MDNPNTSVCSHTRYSLVAFLMFPLVEILQQNNIPILIGSTLALLLPLVLVDPIVKLLNHTGYITLVSHEPNGLNHKHSPNITICVILHSLMLGILLTIGLIFVCTRSLDPHFVPLGFYFILLSMFHFSEYFVTSITNPTTLGLSSFLINQSHAYATAILSSVIEYCLEAYLFPKYKKFNTVSIIGLVVAIMGEVVRKVAMFTAGKNFSHCITQFKTADHMLVTHGIYSYFRHPSYAGWFYWAIGSQVLLLNPICVILFFLISYRFFKDRIRYEEQLLIDFFGDDYKQYQSRVSLWMPISL